jgi:hypothetical protein
MLPEAAHRAGNEETDREYAGGILVKQHTSQLAAVITISHY